MWGLVAQIKELEADKQVAVEALKHIISQAPASRTGEIARIALSKLDKP